ncbi:hypothetical protein C8Q80DRAFT_1265684 [Daedaleopsis nitida]|nr:hypothetical protein C8Q80DRAFT_1265684 [Daedaleopsis nitida]
MPHGCVRCKIPQNAVRATGSCKNFNSIEDFKDADKSALFNHVADETWKSIVEDRSTVHLTRFLLITFANLEKYKYYYWFAFLVLAAKPAWEIDGEWGSAEDALGADVLSAVQSQVDASPRPLPFFLIRTHANQTSIAPIKDYASFVANVPASERTIAFVDPSALPSRSGIVKHAGGESAGTATKPSAVGWERNIQGKLGPRVADLAPMMDPTRLADQAVDLNLKLMRWCILPGLDLDKAASTRCLLLGAGTLGCYATRTLMGWACGLCPGFVLKPGAAAAIHFKDCLNGGKPKAACAAEKLKKVFPGVPLTVPTERDRPQPEHSDAGHPHPPAPVEQTKKDVATLEKLVDDHNVIFLLMDSRESRWLPTVLGTAKGKIVLNVALGFNTFLVMRHGTRTPGADGKRLGCY